MASIELVTKCYWGWKAHQGDAVEGGRWLSSAHPPAQIGVYFEIFPPPSGSPIEYDKFTSFQGLVNSLLITWINVLWLMHVSLEIWVQWVEMTEVCTRTLSKWPKHCHLAWKSLWIGNNRIKDSQHGDFMELDVQSFFNYDWCLIYPVVHIAVPWGCWIALCLKTLIRS